MPVARRPKARPSRSRRVLLKSFLLALGAVIAGFYLFVLLSLILLRWADPPSTAVQAERRIASILTRDSYHKRYHFVPIANISPHLLHAVIAAEDARFFQHHGFDWKEISVAVQSDLEGHRPRGASTITQQLVRNLFLSTGRSVVRKAVEFSLVPFTEAILPKQRILELYVNVIEWGPGVYGAESAARTYYGRPARGLTRNQAVELASLLPAPLHRHPGSAEWYVARIQARMRQMGW